MFRIAHLLWLIALAALNLTLLRYGDGFLVTRSGGFVGFQCFGRWRPGFEEVYRRHGADGVCVDAIAVLALEVTNCGRLRLDWPRVGRDLRYLRLAGRIGFPVEDIAEA